MTKMWVYVWPNKIENGVLDHFLVFILYPPFRLSTTDKADRKDSCAIIIKVNFRLVVEKINRDK